MAERDSEGKVTPTRDSKLSAGLTRGVVESHNSSLFSLGTQWRAGEETRATIGRSDKVAQV